MSCLVLCWVFYAASFAARSIPISGDFWGAMWTNTGLAGLIFVVAIIMTLQGLQPYGASPEGGGEVYRDVYYLYALYFIISLPGVFAIMRGNDNRSAALFFSAVALFNGLAAIRVGYWLIDVWK